MMITGILRRLGPIGRKLAWDREFSGAVPSFSGQRSETLLNLARQYGTGGTIVELGCGDGSLARRLDFPFRFYDGRDISSAAVERAQKTQGDKQQFSVCAMEDWRPAGWVDLLVLEEVLYYASPVNQRAILKRAFEAGADVLIVIHDAQKHAATLGVCREVGRVLEHVQDGKRVYLVLEERS